MSVTRWSELREAVAGMLSGFKDEIATMLRGWGIGPDGVDLTRARGDADVGGQIVIGGWSKTLTVEDPASLWVRATANWKIEWVSMDAAVAPGSAPITILLVKNSGTISGTIVPLSILAGDDQAFFRGTAVLTDVDVARTDRFRFAVTSAGDAPAGKGLTVGLWGDVPVDFRRVV